MIFNFYYIVFSLFYLSLFFVLYIHFFYPLLLSFILVCKKGKKRTDYAQNYHKVPFFVTIIIAAYNEEAVIEKKILNTLQLKYPQDQLEVIIFSDGSTDKTDSIIQKYCSNKLKLNRIEGRLGKTACQNIVARKANGEIIIYSDATSIYRRDAVAQIVTRFNNNKVGCVVGKIGSEIANDKKNIAQEETLYLKFAQWLKKIEGYASMPVGASGAIFAIRKNLLVELPPHANDDLLRPLSVIQQGYAVVYEPRAIATELFQENYKDIFKKKIRIAKRAVFSLFYARSLLNPLQYGLFSLQFLTKTLLRRLLLPGFLILLFSSLYLAYATNNVMYLAVFSFQISIFALAVIGYFSTRFSTNNRNIVSKVARFCYYYFLSITGAIWGIILGFSGEHINDWKPKR